MKTTFNAVQEYLDNDIFISFRISFIPLDDDTKMELWEVTLRMDGYNSVCFDHFPTWEEIREELHLK